MLTLNVQVPPGRDTAAFATLRDGFRTIMSGNAVASSTPAIATRQANPSCDPMRLWGHPPFGSYRLLNHRPATGDEAREYGSHLLLFEPLSGEALQAEAYGRLALLVYGGPPGRDRKMRRTQGGLRLADEMLHAIVDRLRPDGDMTLEIEQLRPPAWWQFWKSPIAMQPLSGSLLAPFQPPADELSVLNALLKNSVRRERFRPSDERGDTFDRDRRDDRSSSGRSSEPVQGKGGEFGGAGASGGWNAPGRGPGVDHAGRIIGGAAAAGAIGALAAGAAGENSRHSDGGSPDTADGGAGSETPGSESGSSESHSTTSTAY
jgi:uncharacterized membrane protein YgcG